MFRYSLENVLDYKRRIEDLHKQTLAALEEKRLIQCQAEDDLRTTLKKCGLVPSNGWDYQNLVDYWEQLLREIQDCNLKIRKLEQEVEAQREKVIEASVDRKKFEVHKDKKLHQYSQAALRKEQGVLDELGSRAYLMQRREVECK